MLTAVHEKSFIATVDCTTPGFEGYWDCAEIRSGKRKNVDCLTVNNYTEGERHRFRFDCFHDSDTGVLGYDIRTDSFAGGANGWFAADGIRLQVGGDGYVGLEGDGRTAPESLWALVFNEDGSTGIDERVELGSHCSLSLLSGQNLLARPTDRKESGEHWFGYVSTESSGDPLTIDLNIISIGEVTFEFD